MAYKSLSAFISVLEEEGELLRIKEFVDPVLEITEVTDRISKQSAGGKAILFENTGTDFPVLMNALGSEKRICLALGMKDLDDKAKEFEHILSELLTPRKGVISKAAILPKLGEWSSWLPKQKKGKAPCQEHIISQPNLLNIPILKCWPCDGGRFVTLPLVITTDAETGTRNVGMYRLQVFDKDLTGMHWHRHKVGARHFEQYKKQNKKMPIAVAIGGDPANTYAATAPLPDHIDEFVFSGFLRKKSVELVKAVSQDIMVPADADFIIEGYIDPQEDFILEGPFGDHTGFYSLADYYPRFQVTCITHRKNAVYPATIVGIPPQEDAYIAKATERIFLFPIKSTIVPEITDMHIPDEGVAHNLTIVKIKKTYPGQGHKVMNSLWGAGQMMFNKILLVVDEDIDLTDYVNFTKTVLTRFNPGKDLFFSSGPLDILDHSSNSMAFGGKLGFDFTRIFMEEQRKEDIRENTLKNDFYSLLENELDFFDTINLDLLKNNIPILITGFWEKESFENILGKIKKVKELGKVKIMLVLDNEVDIYDHNMVAWMVLGNIDPSRDIFILEMEGSEILVVNARRKTKSQDAFKRDWPNIIVSDNETIKKIDEKWDKFGIGPIISSPSLKYNRLVFNKGAVFNRD